MPTLILLVAWPAAAQRTIALGGSDWSVSVSSADLTAAGTDFAVSFRESGNSQELITVNTGNAAPWEVTAHLRVPAGQNWPAGLTVYAIVTGTGSSPEANASINVALNTPRGPLPTEPLGTTPATLLFDGRRQRDGVPVKLRIEGVSAIIPAGVYMVDVVYTVQ